MWTDNETERDFLNFSGIAATVAEVIRQVSPHQFLWVVREHGASGSLRSSS
jgi:hypothetical protein